MQPMDWPLFGLCMGVSIGVGLVVFHVVAAYYHVRYYVRRKDDPAVWKCQPRRFLRPEQQRNAALLSSFNMVLGGTISGFIVYGIATDQLHIPVYLDVADYGWAWTLASIPLYFIVADGGAYYIHRALHIKQLYRPIHRIHHSWVATSPYVTVAVHPLELLALQFSSLLPIFLVPLHAGVIGGVLIYILVFNIIDHSGVRLASMWPWQGPSMFHDDHHSQFHVNFGQHLMFWDRFHGTLRRNKRKYGVKVFGGRGSAQDGGGEGGEGGGDDFVAYGEMPGWDG